MATVLVRWVDDTGQARSGELHDITSSDGAPWRWIDVVDADETTLGLLQHRFDLHPLLVEDVLHPQPRPKLDIFGSVVFLAWLIPVRRARDEITAYEFDVFLGPDFLITFRHSADHTIGEVVSEVADTLSMGPDWLLHAIIDRLVDSILPLADDLGDELEQIEDVLLAAPRPDDLKRLYAIRRQLAQMHRIVAPERDIIRSLARERAVVSEEAYRYLQDVGDHLARVEDSIENYRDVGAAAMDIYLSAQDHRMNEIMKQLTVVATIFMPLTLISGIYGMNLLRGMWPSAAAPWSFLAVVIAMAIIAAVMSLYFRRKHWW